ncbi:flavodoxin FldA [Prevotella sp. kh1p2]|uniref:flavodoxin FldA n=1 Tax=Prevotella sp. kh1p2 TaxID=1761883 RepID=UPI0008C47D99|nr:flavodoxin FldA [Prevotella sp. kh1p2]SET15798.1 flavodoxin I [Prevotella sp. kh1p2]SNU12106.1 flavodoxin I [Prevotellaceae bacterium KH2P17]
MKTLVVYGSTTGTAEDIANRIAQQAGGADVVSAADLTAADLTDHDLLILGSSTWGAGDLQDDWFDALPTLTSAPIGGKRVAIFGVGDSAGYPDTFCGSMKALYDAATQAGATVVGAVPTNGYSFDDSEAVVDGKFVGLALDETNESDKTDERIASWLAAIGA